MGTGDILLGVTLQWTSIPSRGVCQYSQVLHTTETGISLNSVGPLGSCAILPTFTYTWMHVVQYLLNLHGDGHYSLKEKVTPESAPIKIPHWVELLTVVWASIVHPIPMKFLSFCFVTFSSAVAAVFAHTVPDCNNMSSIFVFRLWLLLTANAFSRSRHHFTSFKGAPKCSF